MRGSGAGQLAKTDNKSSKGSDIVKVDSDTVNCDRELGPLATLAALLLAENLAGKVATRTIRAVERRRQRLQNVWRVYLKLGSHFECAVAADQAV
jgi:hypothetical protein